MLKLLALLATILVAVAPADAASQVKARIPAGIGILLISNGPTPLAIYKEPSLGRVAEIYPGKLPSLSQSISWPEGSIAVIATSKKSGWYRIIYDDGEREGWIEGRPAYQLFKWETLLINRPIALIGGLRKEFYMLRRKPDRSTESVEILGKGVRVTSLSNEGDWIKVISDSKTMGWLRWRDENGRLVIALSL